MAALHGYGVPAAGFDQAEEMDMIAETSSSFSDLKADVEQVGSDNEISQAFSDGEVDTEKIIFPKPSIRTDITVEDLARRCQKIESGIERGGLDEETYVEVKKIYEDGIELVRGENEKLITKDLVLPIVDYLSSWLRKKRLAHSKVRPILLRALNVYVGLYWYQLWSREERCEAETIDSFKQAVKSLLDNDYLDDKPEGVERKFLLECIKKGAKRFPSDRKKSKLFKEHGKSILKMSSGAITGGVAICILGCPPVLALGVFSTAAGVAALACASKLAGKAGGELGKAALKVVAKGPEIFRDLKGLKNCKWYQATWNLFTLSSSVKDLEDIRHLQSVVDELCRTQSDEHYFLATTVVLRDLVEKFMRKEGLPEAQQAEYQKIRQLLFAPNMGLSTDEEHWGILDLALATKRGKYRKWVDKRKGVRKLAKRYLSTLLLSDKGTASSRVDLELGKHCANAIGKDCSTAKKLEESKYARFGEHVPKSFGMLASGTAPPGTTTYEEMRVYHEKAFDGKVKPMKAVTMGINEFRKYEKWLTKIKQQHKELVREYIEEIKAYKNIVLEIESLERSRRKD